MRHVFFLGVTLSVLFVAASHAEAQRIALGDFSGPSSDRVRESVHERIAAQGGDMVPLIESVGSDPATVASASGADIVLIGEVIRRRRQWRGRVQVFDASGNQTGEATARSSGGAGLAAALARNLQSELPEMSVLDGANLRVLVRAVAGSGASRVEAAMIEVLDGDENITIVRELDAQEAAELIGVSLEDSEGLARVCDELGLSGVIEGQISRGRRRRSFRVQVSRPNGEVVGQTAFQGRNATGIARSVSRRGEERLIPLLAELVSETNVNTDGGATDVRETRVAGNTSSGSDRGLRPDFRPGGGDLPVAFEAWIGMTAIRRTLDWEENIAQLNTFSTSPMAPEFFIGFRWYPAAHVLSGWPSFFGIDAEYRRVFGLSSTRTRASENSTETFETGAQSFHAGLRVRLPVSIHEFSVFLGYGGQNFFVDANQANEAVLDALPRVPTVDYRFLRASAEARIGITDLRFSVNIGYDYILDFGGVGTSNWLPLASGGAIETGATVGYQFLVGGEQSVIEPFIGFDFRRFYVSSNVSGRDGFVDPAVVGGMVDQYFRGSIGIIWRR